jgi:deferrochelatase/peroxidase EfeB
VQACADDPQVAFHAVRNLRRIAQGTAVLRWTQLGFGKTSSTSTAQATPRNLMGFKDGTNNIKGEQSTVLDKQVWVGTETDQQWMRGGSYLVTRRIAMRLEAWDRDFLADQEKTFGRVKDTGAPLGEKGEFDTVPLAAKNPDGTLVIDQDAHIRLASPETNGGHKLLRRGYSYIDGVIAETGQLDAGLFFIVFQQDPRRQFVPIQRKLGSSDLLNEYIQHTSSALFACPPGFRQGEMIGAALFA